MKSINHKAHKGLHKVHKEYKFNFVFFVLLPLCPLWLKNEVMFPMLISRVFLSDGIYPSEFVITKFAPPTL